MVLPVPILLHGIMYFMTSGESFWIVMMAEVGLLYSHGNLKQVAVASQLHHFQAQIKCEVAAAGKEMQPP